MVKTQFNIKIEAKDLKLINMVAHRRGQGAADFARIALRKELARLGFLSVEETRALEAQPN